MPRAVSSDVPRMMELIVSSLAAIAGALVVVGERAEVVHASTRRSRATEVRAARSSSAGGQSGWTSKCVAEISDARVDLLSRLRAARSALSSSTSRISMWPPKVMETCVMSV